MITELKLGDISVDVVFKNIKNVHLSVYPPTGRVRISAPARMSLDTIRVFAISRIGWIKQHQTKLLGQERETPREYLDRESHYVWGRRYLLEIIITDAAPRVEQTHNKIILRLRPGTDSAKSEEIIARWYREQMKAVVPGLIAKWEPIMGVKVDRFFVQTMKTKWGGCSPETRSIRLNTDLAKKPPECLEYIVVHEMVHLLVRNHGDGFTALMDQYLPSCRLVRQTLNEAPLAHINWAY